jgi:hypothetical protein
VVRFIKIFFLSMQFIVLLQIEKSSEDLAGCWG